MEKEEINNKEEEAAYLWRKRRDDIFFFKQKTAYEIYQCDWSSDVCSSDLGKHNLIWRRTGFTIHKPPESPSEFRVALWTRRRHRELNLENPPHHCFGVIPSDFIFR